MFTKHAALNRREWMKLSAAGVVGGSLSGWIEQLASAAVGDPARRRACILLWMNGGPSQLDTFDLKPGTENGGPFKAIQTAVPGVQISEHLPQLARLTDHLALVRSMKTREGDHGRATYLMRTGYVERGGVRYPTLGSWISKELASPESALPGFVSIGANRAFSPLAYGPGFLGSQHAPLLVGNRRPPAGQQADDGMDAEPDYGFAVDELTRPGDVSGEQFDRRVEILSSLNDRFAARQNVAAALAHRVVYHRAVRLTRSAAAEAFELDEEPAPLRDAYGRNRFGQGCLLARRLVERGVPFVEVTLSGVGDNAFAAWDTHSNNFDIVRQLSGVLDPAWATLIEDLKQRGLLDNTLIVWMGEFGRTPTINDNGGRDHYPQAWSTVLAGGGIYGGPLIGRTSDDGMAIEDRPVTVPDLLATICHRLGIDPHKENMAEGGRPISVVDAEAEPIEELVG